MAFKPWLNSTDLIAAVKRKISFPTYQSTFTDQEILNFASEELLDTLVPSIMKYQQDYFMYTKPVSLIQNQSKYPIPDRALVMKLNDVMYADGIATPEYPLGNLYEMTQIESGDKAYFQTGSNVSNILYRYYVEANNVVLTPPITNPNPSSKLLFYFYFRPGVLVEESRVFICSNFVKTVTVDNSTLVANDTITIGDTTFTAVAGTPAALEFQIGGTSSATASNLSSAINTANISVVANNGTPATNTIKLSYYDRSTVITSSNSVSLLVQSTLSLESLSAVPSNITINSRVDFLQTKPGHKTYDYDIRVLNAAGTLLTFTDSDVPSDYVIEDYICSVNEAFIPQIPPEFHSSLAQRVCARILEALGANDELAIANQKIASLDKTEDVYLSNRVDEAPKKLLSKTSLLRISSFNRFGRRN